MGTPGMREDPLSRGGPHSEPRASLPDMAGGGPYARGGRQQWGHLAKGSVGCKSEGLWEMPAPNSAPPAPRKQAPCSLLWSLSLLRTTGSRKQPAGPRAYPQQGKPLRSRAGGWSPLLGLVPLEEPGAGRPFPHSFPSPPGEDLARRRLQAGKWAPTRPQGRLDPQPLEPQ